MIRRPSIRARRVGGLVLLTLAVSACSVSTDGGPHDIVAPQRPDGTAATTSGPHAPSTGRPTVYFFARTPDRMILVAEERPAIDSIDALLRTLLAGPTGRDHMEHGDISRIPEGTTLTVVSLDVDGTLVVDANAVFVSAGDDTADSALAQIVMTATSFAGVRRVRLLVGAAVHVWTLPSGATTGEAVAARDFEELLGANPATPTTTTGG